MRLRMPARTAGFSGLKKFAGVEDLDGFCAAAETIDAAADPAALALYAGVSAEPRCDDLAGRAMQLVTILREYRGSAHLAAIRSLGLDPAVAHAIKRPDDITTFGHTEPPAVTATDRAKYDSVEALTDTMVLDAYSAVDGDGADALMAGLRAMEAAIGR